MEVSEMPADRGQIGSLSADGMVRRIQAVLANLGSSDFLLLDQQQNKCHFYALCVETPYSPSTRSNA
jgi:hypothetical protein